MSRLSCATKGCGHVICLDDHVEARLRQDHTTFYCPAGHRNYFPGKTREEKRIEQLEARLASRDKLVEYYGDLLALRDEERRDALRVGRTCPLCGERLRGRRILAAHLVDAHRARPLIEAPVDVAAAVA